MRLPEGRPGCWPGSVYHCDLSTTEYHFYPTTYRNARAFQLKFVINSQEICYNKELAFEWIWIIVHTLLFQAKLWVYRPKGGHRAMYSNSVHKGSSNISDVNNVRILLGGWVLWAEPLVRIVRRLRYLAPQLFKQLNKPHITSQWKNSIKPSTKNFQVLHILGTNRSTLSAIQ